MLRWYPFLTKDNRGALLNVIKRDNVTLIISKVDHNDNRSFAHLTGVGNLVELLLKTPTPYLAYHEYILGERPQKMRFDIDLTDDRAHELGMQSTNLTTIGEEICHRLIESIITTIHNLTGRTLEVMTDILLTESHGPGKFSRHIILSTTSIDGYKEAHHLFNLITAPFTEWVRTGIIDPGIYSKLKSFRILGCAKLAGDNRIKKLTKVYTHKDVEYTYTPRHYNPSVDNYLLLVATLISNVDNCQLVPIVLPAKEYPNYYIGDQTLDYVIKIVHREFGNVYEFNDVKGNSVCFNRLEPSYCDICRRIHEKMNMLVLVQRGRLVQYCGRSNGIGQILEGDLGDEYAPHIVNDDEEEEVGMLLRTPLDDGVNPNNQKNEKVIEVNKIEVKEVIINDFSLLSDTKIAINKPLPVMTMPIVNRVPFLHAQPIPDNYDDSDDG